MPDQRRNMSIHVLRPFDWKKGPQSGNTMCGMDAHDRARVTSSPVHATCDDCHTECYRAAKGRYGGRSHR